MRDDQADCRVTMRNKTWVERSCAIGRTRVRPAGRSLLTLLLLGTIVLVWFSIREAGTPAMRLARGIPNVLTTHLAFSPDGATVATTQMDGWTSLWKSSHGWRITQSVGHPGYARIAAFSPDGHWLAVGGAEPGVILYDLQSPNAKHVPGMPVGGVNALVFSPDGRMLAASSSLHREVFLWDIGAGRERARLRGHASSVACLAIARDGRSLASGGQYDGTIIIWDIATGRPRHRLDAPGGPVISLAYSPDGSLLVSAGRSAPSIRLWDPNSGQSCGSIGSRTCAASLNPMDLSRDGRILAFADAIGQVELWDIATSRQLGCLDQPNERLRGVAFSPDGTTLVATSSDNDLRFWKLTDLADAGERVVLGPPRPADGAR